MNAKAVRARLRDIFKEAKKQGYNVETRVETIHLFPKQPYLPYIKVEDFGVILSYGVGDTSKEYSIAEMHLEIQGLTQGLILASKLQTALK